MEAPLQQRIVGAIVLVTLGVIFIPALLDGSGYKARQAKDIVIREKPRFPSQSKKRLDPIPTPLDAKRNIKTNIKTKQPNKQAAVKSVATKTVPIKDLKSSKSEAMSKVESVAKEKVTVVKVEPKTKVKTDDVTVGKTKASEISNKKRIKSFAIQVGTFDDNKNAKKIRNELRKAGYTAYIQKSESKTNPSYRVRIGPELDYDVLEKRLVKLKKSKRYDGYIVNHP